MGLLKEITYNLISKYKHLFSSIEKCFTLHQNKTRYPMIKIYQRTALIVFFAALAGTLFAQTCSNCTWHITGNDTSSYTIGTGQTLCVDTSGIVTGTIILQGGTICNNGTVSVSGITLSSGMVVNKKKFITSQDLSINNGVIIQNEGSSAIIKVNGTLSSYSINFMNGYGANIDISGNVYLHSGTIINLGYLKCHLFNKLGGGLISPDFITETGL